MTLLVLSKYSLMNKNLSDLVSLETTCEHVLLKKTYVQLEQRHRPSEGRGGQPEVLAYYTLMEALSGGPV